MTHTTDATTGGINGATLASREHGREQRRQQPNRGLVGVPAPAGLLPALEPAAEEDRDGPVGGRAPAGRVSPYVIYCRWRERSCTSGRRSKPGQLRRDERHPRPAVFGRCAEGDRGEYKW
jgi:hypothetical protein